MRIMILIQLPKAMPIRIRNPALNNQYISLDDKKRFCKTNANKWCGSQAKFTGRLIVKKGNAQNYGKFRSARRTDLCVARRPVDRLSASCFAAPRLASMEARFRSRCEGGNSCSCCCWCCCCCCCSPERKPANSRSCLVTEVSSTRAPEPRMLVVVVPEPAARWEELLYRRGNIYKQCSGSVTFW
jgi:hypothetical protein